MYMYRVWKWVGFPLWLLPIQSPPPQSIWLPENTIKNNTGKVTKQTEKYNQNGTQMSQGKLQKKQSSSKAFNIHKSVDILFWLILRIFFNEFINHPAIACLWLMIYMYTLNSLSTMPFCNLCPIFTFTLQNQYWHTQSSQNYTHKKLQEFSFHWMGRTGQTILN